MKKILIDLTSTQAANNIKINGGGEYALAVFKRLLKYNIGVVAAFSGMRQRRTDIEAICELRCVNLVFYHTIKEFSAIIDQLSVDTVFFPVCYPDYAELEIASEKRVVSTVHDLSYIYADQELIQEKFVGTSILNKLIIVLKYGPLQSYMMRKHIEEHKKILNFTNNQIIITDSEYTKYALKYYLKENSIPVKVLYPINIESDMPKPNKENAFLLGIGIVKKKFILLVSGNRWHKNNLFALKAIDHLISEGQISIQYKIVLTGTDKKHIQYFRKIIKNKNNFIFLDYIADDDIQILYKNAFIFIYASLFEGFGYPPLSAMKYSTQLLCSDRTSIPEICGEAAFYFSPNSEESFSISLMRMIEKGLDENKVNERYSEIVQRQYDDTEKLCEIITN